jgi:hypothetical protein
MAGTIEEEGRLRMQARVRSMLVVVWVVGERPSIARLPIQKQEDIGAMIEVRFSLRVVIRTTGVPQ